MIRLIGDYVVTVDPYNYTLAREFKNPKGETYLKNISYHGSLQGAVEACQEEYRRKNLGERDMTLAEALQVIRNCDREFEKVMKEVIT